MNLPNVAIEIIREIKKTNQMKKTIYQEIMAECPENFVGNHQTDLYILKNDVTKEIIERHYKMPTVMAEEFTDQTTGIHCYDIPFGYDPSWMGKSEKVNRAINVEKDM